MEKYEICEKLGDGTYGTVNKAINKEKSKFYINLDEYVAIKRMKKKSQNWEECINMQEVKALLELKHPNIVTMKELILTSDGILNMIFEYIGINLYEYTSKYNKEIPEIKIRNIIFQVLQGLAHMHSRNIFHRDMKPENILINDDNVKIADFGLAKEIKSKQPFTDYVATRWYRSPEVILKSKSYSAPIDIFAVGAIMAELFNNKPLFPGKSEFEQMGKICDVLGTPTQNDWPDGYNLAARLNYKFPNYKGQKLRNLIPRASDNAINLLELMLSFNPNKRPTATQCLQHPFFQSFDILYFYGLKQEIQSSSRTTNSISSHLSAISPIRTSLNNDNSKRKYSSVITNHFNLINSKKNSMAGIESYNNNVGNNTFTMLNNKNSQVSIHSKDKSLSDLTSMKSVSNYNKMQKSKLDELFHL
jgi:protein kinase